MKKLLLFFGVLLMSMGVYGQTNVNFDDPSKWTAGSAALNSYAINHTYIDGVFFATGGEALRNGTAAQDWFPGALGTYSWRLRDISTVDWEITIASGGVDSFSIDIRRWDASPSPNYSLDYSVDGGATWTIVSTINNTTLGGTSNWVTFSGVINSSNSNILIRLKALGTTERIMIDNFYWTPDSIGNNPPIICNANVEIESILINSCGGSTEGENEMFRFFTDDTISVSDIEANWPNNSWLGICQNSTTAEIVDSINSTITAGGQLIESIGGIIPPNSQVMFFTSTDFDYTLFDFSDLNYNLYVIFQCPGNTNGHFVNEDNKPGNGCGRTLILTVNGCDADTVTYDACILDNVDGEAVDFEVDGTPTYGNTGGCIAPIFELPIELLYFYTTCNKNDVILNWATVTETNNNFFTLLRSYDAVNFEQIALINGAGNSNSLIEYNYNYNESSDIVYYKLKQTDFDGNYSYSDIVVLNCFDKNKEYKIIPNPAKNGMFIVSGTTDEDIIIIFDIMGRKCEKAILDKGCYSVFVNKTYVGKLIID